MLRTVFLKNSYQAAILLALGCHQPPQAGKLPYYNTPDFTPQFVSTKEVAQKISHTIDPFSMTDQDGVTITEKAITGKIHVADFIFTSCASICPVMTENMAKLAKGFQYDTSVVLLSFSVTPWIDTPEKLRKYKAVRGIPKKDWHFLTGDKANIYSLARTSYFAEEDIGFSKDSSQFLHTEHFILVDASKRIRGIYNGTLPLEIEKLAEDIRALQQESDN
jgi:protein SCO1/2